MPKEPTMESTYQKLEDLGSCRMTLKEVLQLAQTLINENDRVVDFARFVPARLAMTVLDLAIRWPRTAFARDVDPDETIPPGTYYAVDHIDPDGKVLKALLDRRDHDQGVPATADDLAAAAVEDYLEADDG